jgi:hypothetical protein
MGTSESGRFSKCKISRILSKTKTIFNVEAANKCLREAQVDF